MILRSCEASVPEARDRADVERRYEGFVAITGNVRSHRAMTQSGTSSTGLSD